MGPYEEYEVDDEIALYQGIINGKNKRPSLNWIICEISDILKSHQYSDLNISPNDTSNHFLFTNAKEKRSRTPPLLDNDEQRSMLRPRSKSDEYLLSPRLALPPPSRWKPDLSRYPVI